ncbi:hypothetical protein P5673_019580 [Acropora cervicornis]|uniref:Uncharacterized protein n=1 Tax=Acropora cervicornis TaxID=6130 RepID=A0AAD9QAW7_ACRCE|nr:hypothetical protein P5673_019580 [Acropora cervicornis]
MVTKRKLSFLATEITVVFFGFAVTRSNEDVNSASLLYDEFRPIFDRSGGFSNSRVITGSRLSRGNDFVVVKKPEYKSCSYDSWVEKSYLRIQKHNEVDVAAEEDKVEFLQEKYVFGLNSPENLVHGKDDEWLIGGRNR